MDIIQEIAELNAARNAVNVEGNMIFLDEMIQGGADCRIGVKESVLRNSKAVLQLKAAVGV